MATKLMAPPAPADAEEKLLTAEEYFASGRTKGTELIDGRIVERMVNLDHGDYAGNIFMHLKPYVREHKLGRVSVEAGFILRRTADGDTVRGPDVVFVEASRLEGVDTSKFIEGAPTLAIEVISPNDSSWEVEDKVRLYFEAGTRVVWIVDPRRRSVTVRRPDGPPATYIEGDIVPGGAILPGFELPVKDIFE